MMGPNAALGGPDSIQVEQEGNALRVRWSGLRGDATGVRVYRNGVAVAEFEGDRAQFVDRPDARSAIYELAAFGPTGEGRREHRIQVGPNGVQTSSHRSVTGGSISTQQSTIRRC